MKPKTLFLVFALAPLSIFAKDGDEAMFGLRWGMNVDQVRAVSGPITKKSADRNLETYTSTSLPKNISDVEFYTLIFSDGKLVKVGAVSKDITDDPAGRSGKERFEIIKSALTEKYGKATLNSQTVGNKLYKEVDEFYECLKYAGCGLWVSLYNSSDKTISIELKGLRRGTGYIAITGEATPQFDQALSVYKGQKNLSDKSAL